jgi:hypothetical protein
MSIELTINRLILNIEEIEKNTTLLLDSKYIDPGTVDLIELYTRDLRSKIDDTISCFYLLLKEYEFKTIQEVQAENLICVLMSTLLLKVLFKISLLSNSSPITRATLLNKLNNLDEGLMLRLDSVIKLLSGNNGTE